MARSDLPESPQRLAEPGLETARFPASRWQRFYWPQARDARASVALNVAMRWRVLGDLSDASLEAALQRAIARHEILRTRFSADQNDLQQIVTEHGHVRLARIDLQRLSAETREAEAEMIAAKAAREPFDPTAATLMRALLLRLAPQEAILCLTFSRLIIDGWSINLLLDELARDAIGENAQRPGAVELQFGDYTLWQEQALTGPAAQTQARAWVQRLNQAPGAFSLAPDHAGERQDVDSIHSMVLDSATGFQDFAHAMGVTSFQLGAALLAMTLSRITGETTLSFSTEVAGREEPMAEHIVGPLINLLPLTFQVPPAATAGDVIAAIATEMRACLAGESIPFANLDISAAGRARLPRLHFVLQKSYISANDSVDPNYGRFRLQSVPSLSTGALWDLNFFMVQREGAWRVSLERDASRFTAATADGLLAYWSSIITAVLNTPNIAVAALPLPNALLTRPALLSPPPASAIAVGLTGPAQAAAHKPAIMALNITSIYFPLARALGEDVAFHDVPIETPETPAPQRYFGDIVRDCVAQVRATRPHGPYVLFGFCVAGALALETARSLRAAGEDVPLVVLCDTWRPGFREDLPRWDKSLRLMRIRQAIWAKHRAQLRSGELDWGYVLRSWPMARRLALADIAEWLGLIKEGPGMLQIEAENRVLADYLHDSQTRFRPKPYDGHVLIFRSDEVLKGRLFPRDFGWSDVLTGAYDVIDCPGQHNEMFRPAGVAILSAAIRAKLMAQGAIAPPEGAQATPSG